MPRMVELWWTGLFYTFVLLFSYYFFMVATTTFSHSVTHSYILANTLRTISVNWSVSWTIYSTVYNVGLINEILKQQFSLWCTYLNSQTLGATDGHWYPNEIIMRVSYFYQHADLEWPISTSNNKFIHSAAL